MFFASGLRATPVGLALGLPLSVIALGALLRQLDLPTSGVPWLAALVLAVVVSVAALASWLPARRAARVDPIVALRSD